MRNIVIIGSGGFAKEVAFLIDDINKKQEQWNILGFIDEKVGEYNGKYKIFRDDGWLENTTDKISVAFGIGNVNLIDKLTNKFQLNKNLDFPNLIHPKAIGDWERIKFGKGNIICAGNIFTTDIKIGSFNIFNLDCTIGHDTIIGDCNIFNPSINISGGVNIDNKGMIGTGSQILQYLNICSNTIIGAGSVVTKNITESGVYVGSPARKIK